MRTSLFLFLFVSATLFAADIRQITTAYLEDYYRAAPSNATSLGIHQYDDKLEDYSAEFNAKRIAQLKKHLAVFESAAAVGLQGGVDRDLIRNQIRAEILERETLRHFQTNPDIYSSAASNSVYVLMVRPFAAPETRLKAVIARENAFNRLFGQARKNLKNPPRIYTEIALEQLPGIVEFFKKDVPLAFAAVKDAKLRTEFAQSNQLAIAMLSQYQRWLKVTLLPKSHGDFRLGAANFAKKLEYEEMTDLPLPELLKVGEANLRANQKALHEALERWKPGVSFDKALAEIDKDHPAPDKLLESVRGLLANLRKFIDEKKIVSIPSKVDPIVQETPPFLRALTFASMDTPGPFERGITEAFYNLTLPEKDWDAKKVEEHMSGYNRGTLISTSVHEAFPGHYVQFLWLKQAPSDVRKVLGANSNAEGWAHYVEQMMLDEGFGNGDPVLRIGQLQDALLRNGRFMVGLKMHTGNMTFDEGVQYFQKEAYLSRANAERETKRGTSDPTYLYYTLGKLQILKLREDYQKAHPKDFSLQRFHNEFLSTGYPPIRLVRRILLNGKDEGSLL